MHSRLSLAVVAVIFLLLNPIYAQIPPGFSPSSPVQLDLSFGSTSITPGQQIGIDGS